MPIPKEIQDFLMSNCSNQWLQFGHIEIYVRQSIRRDPTKTTLIRTFDIANISCGHKGCSIFTQLFDSLEDLYSYGFGAIYIEQVMTDRFADFFRRKSCTEVKDLASIPSFFYFLNN